MDHEQRLALLGREVIFEKINSTVKQIPGVSAAGPDSVLLK